MADVLLGQAYYLRFDPKLWEAQQPYRAARHAVRRRRTCVSAATASRCLMRCSPSRPPNGAPRSARTRPRLAVIYEDSFNYLSKMCLLRMREAALDMIDRARGAGVPVIVSGSDATDHPEIYLRRGAAAVILGEGEVDAADLADRVLVRRCRSTMCRALPSWMTRARCARPRPGRSSSRSTSCLFRHGISSISIAIAHLARAPRLLFDEPRDHARLSYHCNWCAKPIYGQRYAMRSPERWRARSPGCGQQFTPITSGSSTMCSG